MSVPAGVGVFDWPEVATEVALTHRKLTHPILTHDIPSLFGLFPGLCTSPSEDVNSTVHLIALKNKRTCVRTPNGKSWWATATKQYRHARGFMA